MVSVEQQVGDMLYKKPYIENEIIEYLISLEYTDIEVSHVDKLKRRIYLKRNGTDRTIFIGLDKNGVIKSMTQLDGRLERLTSASSIGCLVGVLIIVGLIIWFIVSWVMDVVSNIEDNDYYEDDNYNEYDDKDADGDVDYDDVDKYLKDSLEEDINDGDDY